MFKIPEKYFCNDTIYRNITGDMYNGVISCGFLNKKNASSSDKNIVFNYYGALLLLSGEGKHIDNGGREFRLYPGCFVQRIPGKPHSTIVHPDGKWLEFFICIGKVMYEALSDMKLLDSTCDVLYPGLNIGIFDTFIKFMDSLKNASQGDLPLLLVEAQRIILAIYRMHTNNTSVDGDVKAIWQACRIFDENTSRHLSAHEVALLLGMGYEKFRKLFKSTMGISPGKYRIQGCMNTAKSILIETDKSIKEVAFELGFPDPVTFSKQFRKVAGMTPGEFKKKY